MNRPPAYWVGDTRQTAFEYDSESRRTGIEYANGVNSEVSFDANGNIRFLRYEKTGVTDPLRSFEWTYDDSNNRESMLDVDPSRAVLWEYGFDWLDRLVTVKRAEAADVGSLPATTLQREYVFDESDNRTFFDDHLNDVTYHYKYKSLDEHVPVYSEEELRQMILAWISQNVAQVIEDVEEIIEDDIENYTGQTVQELELLAQEDLEEFVALMEDTANQTIEQIYEDDFQEFNVITRYSDQIEEILIYNTVAGHRTVGDFVSLETFLHDADGNMTKRTIAATGEEIDYSWTEFDRLKAVDSSVGGHMQDARYNIDGLRHRKLDANGNSSEEYGVGISTAASAPGNGSSNSPSISYISGHMIMGAEIDGTFVFHLGDALSTVRDVVDDTGAVIKSFEFDEYGNLLSSSGSGTTSPKTWIGGLSVNDDRADSGMFNMGHRNYAAGVLGRFISRDPIGHRGGLNLYEAMKSNPVRFTDQSGLGPDDPWWIPPFLREGKSSKCGPLNFKMWSQKDTSGWMKEIFDPGYHDTTDRLMETKPFDRDEIFNRGEMYEQRTQSGGGKPPGKIPHQSMGRFSANIAFFGPLKFLNFLNNVNDARSIYQTLCDGPSGYVEIPTIYRDGTQMSPDEYRESRLNDRIYMLGWNIFQTRTIGPYDTI